MFFVRTDEIDWIEAAGNYVRLHVGADSHLFRETMNSVEARLDRRRFFRIHRSPHRQHRAGHASCSRGSTASTSCSCRTARG